MVSMVFRLVLLFSDCLMLGSEEFSPCSISEQILHRHLAQWRNLNVIYTNINLAEWFFPSRHSWRRRGIHTYWYKHGMRSSSPSPHLFRMLHEKTSDDHIPPGSASHDSVSNIDLYSYHEQRAGRLIIDPMYASDFIFDVYCNGKLTIPPQWS